MPKYSILRDVDDGDRGLVLDEVPQACTAGVAHVPHVAVTATLDGGAELATCVLAAEGSSSEERSSTSARTLRFAIVFCSVIMVMEAVGGIYTNSLAVLNDAVHLMTDVLTLSISLLAARMSALRATQVHSYGWGRAEVIGALTSVLTTWALVVWITFEGTARFIEIVHCARQVEGSSHCRDIDAPLMLLIGIGGLMVNLVCAIILYYGGIHMHSHSHLSCDSHAHSHGELELNHQAPPGDHDDGTHDHDHGHNHDHLDRHDHDHGHGDDSQVDGCGDHTANAESMNVRAALLHIVGDCLQSAGVVVAAAVICIGNKVTTGDWRSAHSLFNVADPLLSFLFGGITIFTTTTLIREVLNLLMEATPRGFDHAGLQRSLNAIDKVERVRDLHVWCIGPTCTVMSVHLEVSNCTAVADANRVVEVAHRVGKRRGIRHSTVQVVFV